MCSCSLLFTQDLDDFIVGHFSQPVSAEHSVVMCGMKIMSELAVGSTAHTSNILPLKEVGQHQHNVLNGDSNSAAKTKLPRHTHLQS